MMSAHVKRPRNSPAPRAAALILRSFNVRPFQPGHANVTVLRPGEFLLRVRDLLARLTDESEL